MTRLTKGEALRWAWLQPRLHMYLSSHAQLVLLHIVDRWNIDRDEGAFPSIADIVKRTHLSDSTVRIALRELEMRQIIRKKPRISAKGRKRGLLLIPLIDEYWLSEWEARRGRDDAAGDRYVAAQRARNSDSMFRKLFALVGGDEDEQKRFGRYMPELRIPNYQYELARMAENGSC